LTQEELEDVRKREEADMLRDDGRKRFAKEIASRVEGLRDAVRSVKGDIMGKGDRLSISSIFRFQYLWIFRDHSDGLTHVFATIKVTPDVRGLPDNYKAVMEWARISLVVLSFTSLGY
jgi:hypothetical protein